jgi:translocation and assembly module TamB
LDPESSDASVDLQGRWERNPHFSSFSLHSALARGTIHATANLKTHSGEAGLDANVVLGDQISYSLTPLYFNNIDLASFLGEKSRSSLTGTLAVKGRGTAPATMTGEAVLDIKPSKLLGIDIQTLTARLGIINGATDIEGSGLTGGGGFGLKAKADFQADHPSVEITDFTFHNLNLAELGIVGAVTTDLNGTLSARASASTSDGLERLVGGASPLASDSMAARTTLVLQESKVDRQRLTGGSVDATLQGREISLSLDVRTPEGGLSLEAVTRPFEESPELTVPLAKFDHVNLGSLMSVEGFGTDLSGTCSIRHQGSSLETAGSRVSIDLVRSSINRESLAKASIEGELDSGKVGVTTTWTFEHGEVDGKVRGVLVDGGFSGTGGIAARIEDLGLLLNDERFSPSRITINVDADGAWGSTERTRLHATLLARGRVDSLESDSVLCRLSVRGRTIQVDTLLIRSNVGLVAGSGPLAILDTTGESVSGFSARAVLRSLKPLEHLLALPPTELDSTRLTCTVTGPAQSTQIAATAAIRSFMIGANSVGSLDASAAGSLRDIEALLASQETTRLAFRDTTRPAGQVNHQLTRGMPAHAEDLVTTQVAAHVTARDAQIGDLEITRAEVTLTSDGKRREIRSSATFMDSLNLLFTGAFVAERPNSTILIDSLQFNGPKSTWNLEHPASILYGEKLRVNDFDLRTRNQSLRADGVLDPRGEQNFTLRADSLQFSSIGLLIRRPELDGTGSFELRITGPAGTARATASMTADIRTRDQPVGSIRADLDWHDSLLSINAEATQPRGGLLTAAARIPRALSFVRQENAPTNPAARTPQRPMDLQLRADRFSLEMIHPFMDPQTFGEVAGILTAEIAGRAIPDSLSLSGRLAIDSGLVRLPSLGVTYDRIVLRSSLDGSDMQLDSVYIHSGPGSLVGRGTISYRNLEKIAPRLRVRASDFLAIQTPLAKVTASGGLEVTGTSDSPVITGKTVLGETEIQVPDLGAAASVEDVELTQEDYRALFEWFGVRKRRVQLRKEESSAESLTLDIGVEMHRNTWIRKKANPNLAIELEGNLHVTSSPGKPFTLSGELRPVVGRSYVGQFGRQFDITGGEVYFSGKPEDLELRIDSDYKVPSKGSSGLSEVVIHMRVMSKLGRFTFELTSDPAMAESDILTYLATGKSSTGALAGTADQGNLGSAAALEQLVGAAQGLAEGKIPLDVFQIRQDGARGITIVAGNYISNRLYVGVRQPLLFEQGTQATTYDTGTQGEFEYEAAPWLFLNFQGGADRIMFFCKSRYVY